jgi:hypothetical protein
MHTHDAIFARQSRQQHFERGGRLAVPEALRRRAQARRIFQNVMLLQTDDFGLTAADIVMIDEDHDSELVHIQRHQGSDQNGGR